MVWIITLFTDICQNICLNIQNVGLWLFVIQIWPNISNLGACFGHILSIPPFFRRCFSPGKRPFGTDALMASNDTLAEVQSGPILLRQSAAIHRMVPGSHTSHELVDVGGDQFTTTWLRDSSGFIWIHLDSYGFIS